MSDILMKKVEIAAAASGLIQDLKFRENHAKNAEYVQQRKLNFSVKVMNENGYSFSVEPSPEILDALVKEAQRQRDEVLEKINALILIAQ
jgi:hypothetical protein